MESQLRNQVIKEVTTDGAYKRLCRLIAGKSGLQDDLYQELCLFLLEYDEPRLREVYEAGKLRFFAARVVCLMFRSYTSPFASKYRHTDFRFCRLSPKIYDERQDSADLDWLMFECGYTDIAKEIEDESWYDWKVFEIWQKEGSVRKVSKKTGIEYRAIAYTVKRVSEKIRKRIKVPNTIKKIKEWAKIFLVKSAILTFSTTLNAYAHTPLFQERGRG